MKLAKLARVVSVATLACIATPVAHAQGVRVFVMGSGSYLQNSRVFTNIFGDRFQSNYATGGKITFGGEYSLASIVGIEGAYGYGSNNLRVMDLATSQTLGYGVRYQRASGNFVVHSPVAVLGVRPYATAGLEYDHLGPTNQAMTTAATQGFAGQLVALGANNKLGFNYGGGAEWSFLPTLALRLDLRDHITGSPTYGLSSRRFPISGAAHDVELSAGLVLHLGK